MHGIRARPSGRIRSMSPMTQATGRSFLRRRLTGLQQARPAAVTAWEIRFLGPRLCLRIHSHAALAGVPGRLRRRLAALSAKPSARAGPGPSCKPHEKWRRVVSRKPLNLLDAADRLDPVADPDPFTANTRWKGRDVVLEHPLPSRLQCCFRNLLAGQIEIARANDIHVVRPCKEAKYAANASIDIQELVETVALVVAISDSDAAAIPDR